jgi:hypothetical protein
MQLNRPSQLPFPTPALVGKRFELCNAHSLSGPAKIIIQKITYIHAQETQRRGPDAVEPRHLEAPLSRQTPSRAHLARTAVPGLKIRGFRSDRPALNCSTTLHAIIA